MTLVESMSQGSVKVIYNHHFNLQIQRCPIMRRLLLVQDTGSLDQEALQRAIGIDETMPRPKKSTMQLRSFNPAHEQKGHAKRVEGLPVKFKQGHSLTEFYDAVTRKLEGYGLDTIAYARDLHNPTTKSTVSVI